MRLYEIVYQRLHVILSEAKNLLDSSSSASRGLLRMTLLNNLLYSLNPWIVPPRRRM